MLMTNFAAQNIETQIEAEADRVVSLILRVSECGPGASSSALAGKTLGIIGIDLLGEAVARRMQFGFGMTVVSYDPGLRSGVPLNTLLNDADVVFLNAKDTSENGNLIDAQRLNEMKPDGKLVARGPGRTLDTLALRHALWFETIGGAALRVCDLPANDLCAFQMCENVVLLAEDDHVPSCGEVAPAFASPSSQTGLAQSF